MEKKKTVGIITLPLHTNYGGILQCWALQRVLEGMGYEALMIRHRVSKTRPLYRILLSASKVWLRNLIKHDKADYKSELIQYNTFTWFNKRTNRTLKRGKDLEYYIKNPSELDIYIVGSDQVWRPAYTNVYKDNYISTFFFNFLPEQIKKISYAASFGIDSPKEFTPKMRQECGDLLSRFHSVSVREKSAIGVIESLGWQTQRPIAHVLDPTLLVSAKTYIDYFKLKKVHKKHKTALVYVLDGESTIWVENLSKQEYEVKILNSCDSGKKLVGLMHWLDSILNADFVLTDSYHCCIFSVIFHRQFVVIKNDLRGNARLDSLLESLELQAQSVQSPTELDTLRHIEYSTLDPKLESIKFQSLTWLQTALKS